MHATLTVTQRLSLAALPYVMYFYSFVGDMMCIGAPRKGQRESPDPLDFDIKFSHIITVAPKPRVEIQMQLLFSESVPAPLDIQ